MFINFYLDNGIEKHPSFTPINDDVGFVLLLMRKEHSVVDK